MSNDKAVFQELLGITEKMDRKIRNQLYYSDRNLLAYPFVTDFLHYHFNVFKNPDKLKIFRNEYEIFPVLFFKPYIIRSIRMTYNEEDLSKEEILSLGFSIIRKLELWMAGKKWLAGNFVTLKKIESTPFNFRDDLAKLIISFTLLRAKPLVLNNSGGNMIYPTPVSIYEYYLMKSRSDVKRIIASPFTAFIKFEKKLICHNIPFIIGLSVTDKTDAFCYIVRLFYTNGKNVRETDRVLALSDMDIQFSRKNGHIDYYKGLALFAEEGPIKPIDDHSVEEVGGVLWILKSENLFSPLIYYLSNYGELITRRDSNKLLEKNEYVIDYISYHEFHRNIKKIHVKKDSKLLVIELDKVKKRNKKLFLQDPLQYAYWQMIGLPNKADNPADIVKSRFRARSEKNIQRDIFRGLLSVEKFVTENLSQLVKNNNFSLII